MSTRIMIEKSLSLIVWLLMATTIALAQSDYNAAVLDTNGNALERGKDYYIKPAIINSGGRFTLINRNESLPCPLYVGQENSDVAEGLPVIFTPLAEEDNVVKVNRDFKVAFSAASICFLSTEWVLGERESNSGRRLIVAGGGDGRYNYFKLDVETQFGGEGIYNIRWCPTDVCPLCRFDCGIVGSLRENGNILLALDGNVLPVVFERA